MTRQTAVAFDAVGKRYGSKAVLSDINTRIEHGEFVGLIGVNGAGKTTLIKCLLDFVGLSAGGINIYGLPHTQPEARNRLAFLPEKFLPPYYLTGRDFLTYASQLYGLTCDRDEVDAILDILDLQRSALVQPVRQYSKGMAQKIGLASSLLSGRELFIFDEPMSGLDPRARANLKYHLLELKNNGQGLFFSTHQLADINVLCDRILILHAGRLCFDGTPDQCCERYDTTDLEQAYMQCIAQA